MRPLLPSTSKNGFSCGGLGGMLGVLTPFWWIPLLSFSISQIFAGAIVIGLYSELMAKIMKAPSTVL